MHIVVPYKYLYFSIAKNINELCLVIFVMAYIRAKKKRRKNYYYIVEGERDDNGKVKQKIIKYLGNIETILEKIKFWEENH